MRLLAPIILLIMTAIAAYREGDDITGIINDKNSVTSQPAASVAEESTETKEASGYGEIVEAPGLLNRVTIFGY